MLAKKCNDMDTASLLIALLRASDVPARYVHGTIEVPIDKLMNWVGGFTDVNSAVGFVGAGGTPIMPIAEGGAIGKVEMEHVWVEAYVDYIPSRGAVHRTGDTWAPLDGSYKQYTYTEGVDLATEVPFDAQAFVDQVQASATVDPVTGAVSGIDQTLIETTLTNYQTQVQDYVTATLPDATGADLIGSKTVVNNTAEFLPLSGPYTVTNAGTKYAVTPDNLRHKITFSTTTYPHIGEDFSVTKSVPELAGKRITLTYPDAGATDADTIIDYQALFGGGAYAMKLKPVIRLDGQVLGTGGFVTPGQKHTFSMTFTSPYYAPDRMDEDVFAGSLYSVVLNLLQVSKNMLQGDASRIVDIENLVTLENIYSDQYSGEILKSYGRLYYYELDKFESIQAKIFGATSLRQVSRGLIKKNVNVVYIFGIPMGVNEGGLTIDVDRDVRSTRSLNGKTESLVIFNATRGQTASILEHSVLEMLYGGEAISAVKILMTAHLQGIPLITIDSGNVSQALSLLQLTGAVKADISSSVNAGKIVTIPKTNVIIGNWVGTGYTVVDPATGQGGYIISGGAAGGENPDITLEDILSTFTCGGTGTAKYYLPGIIMVNAAGTGGATGGWGGCWLRYFYLGPIPDECLSYLCTSVNSAFVFLISVLGATYPSPLPLRLLFIFGLLFSGLQGLEYWKKYLNCMEGQNVAAIGNTRRKFTVT